MQLEMPAGATVGDVLTRLETSYPRIKDYRRVVLTAVNEEYVDHRALVQDGDEVAIFPPVSGGEVDSETSVISPFPSTQAVPVGWSTFTRSPSTFMVLSST